MEDADVNDDDFGFSRNYFLAKELQGSAKKSKNKISDIDLINEEELRLQIASLETHYEKEIKDLLDNYKKLYASWRFKLKCNFGLLMYGFGSKRALIEDFASTELKDHSVLVVNGYIQSINMKEVLATLAELVWEQMRGKAGGPLGKLQEEKRVGSKTGDDILSFLEETNMDHDPFFVCLLVHNIDGVGLREPDTQRLLARVASCSHVRLVASVDHVNAPLLWDKEMVHRQFNWSWCHVPTFAPYKAEGVFTPLLLTLAGAAQTSKTAALVLQSLTPNAQSVFKSLASHQLSHPSDSGMLVSSLYTECRERFVVSSLATLNSHLTEFKDHDLVKTRKNSDGQDCLFIPMDADAIQSLLSDLAR